MTHPPTLRLYNTLTRQKQPFMPQNTAMVQMYTCGPTVYAPAHVGNLRSYIFPDVLKRLFWARGWQVKHVINITDVGHLTSDADEGEDKLEWAAREEECSAWEIAAACTACFLNDLQRLSIEEASVYPKATDHITEQIDLIQRLEKKGFTYQTTDGVYYNTTRFSGYGKMAQLNTKGMREGMRVNMGEKRHKTDFALWKFCPSGSTRQMEWDSPWGKGFPGWHVECSAMAMKHLSKTLDVHTGGVDHIPVHHTNEIAQSEGATNKPFVRFWLHGQFLTLEKEQRMGKSKGNFLILDDLISRGIEPLAFRYLALNTHYRQFLQFTWPALQAAQTALQGLRKLAATLQAKGVDVEETHGQAQRISATFEWVNEGLKTSEASRAFIQALCDDLNTPKALGILWAALRTKGEGRIPEKRILLQLTQVLLGLKVFQQPAQKKMEVQPIANPIQALAQERWQAKLDKDFTKADALRAALLEAGYKVKDTRDGYELAAHKPL